jgi:hypothetical protein
MNTVPVTTTCSHRLPRAICRRRAA